LEEVGGKEAKEAMVSPSKPVEKYWMQPITSSSPANMVVIHVCDENRQIKRDFVCKKDILVHHMKYFQSFLNDNESGYDDIDISVHCDVEIFEWLMAFIHEPHAPPHLDKTIVVSILISSEFLQMDQLVDVCLEHIASNISDIIKLPIDLSCISEKLVNKLAFMIPPRILAETKDRKDKILNKLYKRRVELDFSRKAGSRGGTRSIAASLTCCQHCGFVYLEMYERQLACKCAKPFIDFRGKLVKRHMAIPGWSLTAYLKSLHAGGMGWEAIYWHVWAACQVFQAGDIVLSALQTNRYSVEEDGLLIYLGEKDSASGEGSASGGSGGGVAGPFSLQENITRNLGCLQLKPSIFDESNPNPYITSTLNPARPAHVLDSEIFLLLGSQARQISGGSHQELISSTGSAMARAAGTDTTKVKSLYDVLWAPKRDRHADAEDTRGRSRSPLSGGGVARRSTLSVPAKGKSIIVGTGDRSRRSTAFEDAKGSTMRSRSTSVGAARQVPSLRKTDADEDDDDDDDEGSGSKGGGGEFNATDPSEKHSELLHAMPPDLARRSLKLGPVSDVWLEPHPLAMSPAAFSEVLVAIQAMSNLSDRKRTEWEHDTIRDTDEVRINRLEEFLVMSRDSSSEVQFSGAIRRLREQVHGVARKREDDRGGKYTYYRDKGRQATKQCA
jgi:hypothetical protein